MAGRRARIKSPKDLLFFLNWDTLPVLVGTIGLALLEIWEMPPAWQLTWFVADYKLQIIIALGLLIVLPPPIARGIVHLRDREDAERKNVEVAVALRALGSRASNFILKMREALMVRQPTPINTIS